MDHRASGAMPSVVLGFDQYPIPADFDRLAMAVSLSDEGIYQGTRNDRVSAPVDRLTGNASTTASRQNAAAWCLGRCNSFQRRLLVPAYPTSRLIPLDIEPGMSRPRIRRTM